VIGTDTLFVFNKAYSNYLVSKFDSLNYFKELNAKYFETIQNCNSLYLESKNVISVNNDLIDNLHDQIKNCDQIAESYYRVSEENLALFNDLKKQNRKRKVSNILSYIFMGTTVLTATFLIVK
jgi:hypothetical protein